MCGVSLSYTVNVMRKIKDEEVHITTCICLYDNIMMNQEGPNISTNFKLTSSLNNKPDTTPSTQRRQPPRVTSTIQTIKI